MDNDAPHPIAAAGEAVIRPLCVGIASSDLEASSGVLGFQGVLGHEFIGVVESVNPTRETERELVGKRVVGSINIVCGKCDRCRAGLSSHCPIRAVLGLHNRDGCFAERFTLPIVNLHEVPSGIGDEAAVFAEPLAAALHISQMIRVEGKTFVTVLGDGPVGLLAAQVMSKLNASVRVLGKHEEKFGLCERWGIKHRHVREAGKRMDQDVVVDCTGSPSGLELALQMVRPRGKIVMKTTPAPVPPEVLPSGRMGVSLARAVCNEVEIVGARCGRMSDAVTALARGEVDASGMVTRRFRLNDGLTALNAAKDRSVVRVLMEP